jgi:4'-phosphopantetheinyl transferase
MAHHLHITGVDFRIDSPLGLPENQVQLWRAELDNIRNDEARWMALLSAEEKTRAGRFHFAADRQRFTTSRALLRMILGGYLNTNPAHIDFAYSEKEKPALAEPHACSGIKFNLSHSGGVGLFAFSRHRELGVDIEAIRPDSDIETIARRFFSAAEQEELSSIPPDEKRDAFFRGWTRKEAYIKARGDGLSLPLHQFDVSLAGGSGFGSALVATRPDASESARWHLREVAAGSGYVAALCVRSPDCELRDWSQID